MRMIGYVDGERSFIRDDVEPHEAENIARHIRELADTLKRHLVLFVEHEGVIHMIQQQSNRS